MSDVAKPEATKTDRPSPTWRLGAAFAGVIALTGYGLAATLFPDNLEWLPGWAGAASLYAVAAVGLWMRRAWARPYAIGIGLFGLAAWLQACWAVGLEPFPVVGAIAHALMLTMLVFVPTTLPGRHRLALVLATAALYPATCFALAPGHAIGTAAAVLSGATLVALGTFGLARGRTWGLLVALLGAPVLGVSIFYAPEVATLSTPHDIIPANAVMLDVLGAAASILASLAVLPFVLPIVRFLLRGETAK